MPATNFGQFFANGVYTITNAKYPKVYAHLIGGNASAAVAGTQTNTGSDRQWIVQSDGNNQITIQNLAATANYASALGQADGVPVLTSTAVQTKWSLASAGGGNYYIRTQDGEYTWNLPSDDDDYTVLLRNSQKNVGSEAQWIFAKV